MTLDLSRLTDQELLRMIAERCSEFGSVVSVRILHSDRASTYHFAVVRMSTPAESSALFMEMGTSNDGDSVVIRLEQRFA